MFSILRDNELLLETFSSFIDRKLEPYDGIEYAYFVLRKKDPSDILIVSSYPDEWVKLYKENNFQNIDPVIFTAWCRSSPFAWDDDLALISNIKFNKIFQLSKKYNVVNGFTFVLHDHRNNLALLSFVLNKKKFSQDLFIRTESKNLQMILIEINEQMHKLCEAVSSGNGDKRNKPLHDIFTNRENEVIYWVSKGKGYAEIAKIIGISVSTVKFHMKNIVEKLGVNNARQAIGLSVELNLIKSIQ